MSKKYSLLSIILNLIFDTPAQAASLTSSFNWDGIFIGAYMGGAAGLSKLKTNVGSLTSTSYFVSNENIASVNRNGSNSRHLNSFTGGIRGDITIF